MKIACGQVYGTVDVDANKKTVQSLVEQAATGRADLILFPEMSVLEFFPRIPHKYEYFDLAPTRGPRSANGVLLPRLLGTERSLLPIVLHPPVTPVNLIQSPRNQP